MAGPLTGIRVLDLTRQLAGPWSAQMLGDLGADVIKVERPGEGDEVRTFGPPFVRYPSGEESREAPFFFAANRNKRSITIDLQKPQGQEMIRRLVPHCDVVIENYRVGTLKRYGLGYEDLRKCREDIIYCSVTGFGQTGPYKDRAGYDSIFQAMCGQMSITGIPDGEPGAGPMKAGIATADILTGMYTSIAMLGALYHRKVTGVGQYIDMCLFDSQIAAVTIESLRYLLIGEIPTRTGNVSRNLVPTQLFECKNGHLNLTIGNDGQFAQLAKVFGHPEWVEDPRFRTGGARRKHRAELIPMIQEIFRTRTVGEWVDLFAPAGIPCGPVNNLKQVFEDPHTVARGMRVEVEHETLGKVPLVANPIKYSESPVEYRLAPPMLGQHTRSILAEFAGVTDAEFEQLQKDAVI